MTWTPDIVIYHSPCDDGFGAAWACHRRWPDAMFYPASYGRPAPDVARRNVLVVDFSFKRPELEQMARSAESIVILDHHKTARVDLEKFQNFPDHPERFTLATVTSMICDLQRGDYPAIACLFDMERSGARLAWEFCFPGDPAPQLIRLIEDRDLWRFAFEETKPFSLWLRSHEMNFDTWDRIHGQLEDPVDRKAIFEQSIGIQAFYDRKVFEMALAARMLPIAGHEVPVVNCSWAFASDVAHALLEAYPQAPFAACYYDRADGLRSYSLRSMDDRQDVSEIAKFFGGGGHRNAAGFEMPAS